MNNTDRRLRIAIDGRPATWPRTGIGTIARNVLLRIAAADSENDYLFYFDREPGDIQEKAGPAICRYGGSTHELLWANSYLVRQLTRDRIDICLTFLDKEIPFLAAGRMKIICMVHDLIPLRFPESVFRNSLHRMYYRTLIRAAVRRADVVLTNSEHSKREIVEEFGELGQKIRPIALGANPPVAVDAASAGELMRRYGLHEEYAIALGSTEPRKNNAVVIRAFRMIVERFPHLRLVIAGARWRDRAFEPGLLDDRVIETGALQDRDLSALLQYARLLIFPSLHEGFGLPVVEAMAHGVPVITSNVTALPEVGGDAALYVNPQDVQEIAAKMQAVLTNPELAAELSERGRRRAASFRWETTCRQIVNIIHELGMSFQRNKGKRTERTFAD